MTVLTCLLDCSQLSLVCFELIFLSLFVLFQVSDGLTEARLLTKVGYQKIMNESK